MEVLARNTSPAGAVGRRVSKTLSVFFRRASLRAGNVILCVMLAGILPGEANALAGPRSTTGDAAFSETAVKAAFIYNLTKFMSWPETHAGFNILALGDPELAGVLSQLVAGEKHGERQIKVFGDNDQPPTHCHLVFVSRKIPSDILERVPDIDTQDTLTVTDHEASCARGFMVYLVKNNRRLIPAFHKGELKKSRIYVSPQLLQLSQIINCNNE